jgi:dihydrofolate reductase
MCRSSLTYHARAPLVMEGGTTSARDRRHQPALRQVREAAAGKDIRVGGGVATVRQYLSARLIDEMHLAMAPTFLGTGENLFAGLDLPALSYTCTDRVSTPAATHLIVTKHRAAS